MKGAYHRVVPGRRHEAGSKDRVSLPLAPSQGGEQETTSAETTGRRHEARRHGRGLPSSRSHIRDASRRRRPARRRGDSTRPGTGVCFSPPSRSQSGMRAGDDDGGITKVRRGRTNQEHFRPGRPLAGSPVNSFPRIELGAPP